MKAWTRNESQSFCIYLPTRHAPDPAGFDHVMQLLIVTKFVIEMIAASSISF